MRQALALLGLRRTCEVAAAAGFAPSFRPRLPGYEVEAFSFWLHCVAVAVLTERLAAEVGVRRPELTFTAGLLHDIGKLAIGAFVSQSATAIGEGMRAADSTSWPPSARRSGSTTRWWASRWPGPGACPRWWPMSSAGTTCPRRRRRPPRATS